MKLFDLKCLGEFKRGFFIERVNRFLAIADVEGEIKKIHIADTGRLLEILTKNRELLLLKNREGLKTDFTLIAAKMEEGWVLINSKVHSNIAREVIKNGLLGFNIKEIKSEYNYGKSRIDFLADNYLIELKGCSLVEDNICLFPNAPTSRGVKHIKELIKAKNDGFKAIILIMAVRECKCFKPHPFRDDEFKNIFYEALKNGVIFKGFFIKIDKDLNIIYNGELKLCE